MDGKTYSNLVTIGSCSTVFITESMISPGLTAGSQFLLRPATQTTITFASSSAADAFPAGAGMQLLVVTGWNSDDGTIFGNMTMIQEAIAMNGQTPVTTVNEYIRLYVCFSYQSGTTSNTTPASKVNSGTVSGIQTGATTFVAGVPVNLAERVAVIDPNVGINFTGQLFIPKNYDYYFTDCTTMTDGGGDLHIKIYGKTYTSSTTHTGFRELMKYIVRATSSSSFSCSNKALPSVNLPPGLPTDIVLSAYRVGGANATNLEVVINGVLVKLV